MKKGLLIFFVMIFLIGNVLGADWDSNLGLLYNDTLTSSTGWDTSALTGTFNATGLFIDGGSTNKSFDSSGNMTEIRFKYFPYAGTWAHNFRARGGQVLIALDWNQFGIGNVTYQNYSGKIESVGNEWVYVKVQLNDSKAEAWYGKTGFDALDTSQPANVSSTGLKNDNTNYTFSFYANPAYEPAYFRDLLIYFSFSDVLVNPYLPVDSSYSMSPNQTFACNYSSIAGDEVISNVTLQVYDSSLNLMYSDTVVGVNNVSVNQTWNTLLSKYGTFYWNCSTRLINNFGRVSSLRTLYLHPVILNSQAYNATTYETSRENFIANITYNSTEYPTVTANLIYNGTSYTGTIYGGSGEARLVRNLGGIPLLSTANIPENRAFYWQVRLANSTGYTYYNLTSQTQTVNPIQLDSCNSTLNNAFVNYTFKDENNLTDLTATVVSGSYINYYLGDGTVYRTLSYYNTTLNPSYNFCFSPAHETLKINPSINYASTGYPQRGYTPGEQTLTNSTTNKTLYLLNSNDGLYVTFLTTTVQSTIVSGATVTVVRTISGTNTTIGIGTTDSAGSYTIWLNPNYPHYITASKTGYGSTTQTIIPTQTGYTLILTGGTGNYSYLSNTNGLRWFFFPSVGLQDNSSREYGFNVSSALDNLVSCKIELLNINKSTVLSTAEYITTNASICSVSTTFALNSTYPRIKGRLLVDIGGGYQILEEDALWALEDVDTTGMTITDWFRGLKEFDLSYFNNNENHREYTNILVFFLLVTIVCAVMNYAGWDIQNQGAMIYLVGFFVIMASIPGFLTLTGISPWELIDKYYVAVIYAMFMGGYTLRNI